MEIYGDLEAGCLSHSVSPIKPASPPRKAGPGRLFCDPCDDADQLLGHHHYLDICFSCRKLLAGNKDIFMYRGDTPFCSEECRQEQIEIDEAREKRSSQTGRAEEQRQRQQQKQSTPRIPEDDDGEDERFEWSDIAHGKAALLPILRLFAAAGRMMKGAGAMSTMKPPSSPLLDGHGHHFLEECSLCGKSLSGDIFMYR
ncbi:hypothetical protein TRIUR3_33801 [Triticum urartu]|uniref:FLZ-type domain-containing protein n=1 Tax=Triticum urartu TaxID=4572 RepID=M8AZP9_TRIUA|nr:hypothetical protein TRIUR3_33801 [Triticum urartu]